MSRELEGKHSEIEILFLSPTNSTREYRDLDQHISDCGGSDMNRPEPAPSLRGRLYKSLKPDWAFGFVLIVGIILLILETRDPVEQVTATWSPVAIAGGTIGVTILVAFLATFMAALDRRKTDDYHFQIMANGAIIAIITAIFVNMVWLMAQPLLGTMSVQILIAILLIAWGLGYFFYRWRGLGQ